MRYGQCSTGPTTRFARRHSGSSWRWAPTRGRTSRRDRGRAGRSPGRRGGIHIGQSGRVPSGRGAGARALHLPRPRPRLRPVQARATGCAGSPARLLPRGCREGEFLHHHRGSSRPAARAGGVPRPVRRRRRDGLAGDGKGQPRRGGVVGRGDGPARARRRNSQPPMAFLPFRRAHQRLDHHVRARPGRRRTHRR